MGDADGYTVTDRRHSAGEVRDPRGATSTIGWISGGRPTLPTWSSDLAFAEGYFATALVNRAINILADRISQLPFRAGADPDSPEDFNTNAKLAKLLGPPPGNPNAEMSARQLWKNAIRNYLVAGRFAWEIDTNAPSETGIALWPLVMGSLAVIPTTSGSAYFEGFEYRVTSAVKPVPYRRDELVYAWNSDPTDPREPMSALRAIRWNVSVQVQIDQYNYAFVKNDAKPATMVVHGPFADADGRDAFRRQFSANFKGPLNANKTVFNEVDPSDDGSVAGMLDIKTIGVSAKDSQLTQIYEQQLDAITTGLGVPMSLMDSSDRTFSNADREMANFYELTVLPLCADLQDHVNRDLAPRLGSEVGWFDLSKVDVLKPKLSPGVVFADVEGDLLVDERRSFAGLGPVDKAELLQEKKDSIEAMQLPGAPAAAQVDNGNPAPSNQPPQLQPVKAPAALPAPPPRTRTTLELMEERVNDARTAAVDRLDWLLTQQLTELTEKSLTATLNRAEGKRGRQILAAGQTADELYDRMYWHTESKRAVAPVLHAALTAAATTLSGLLPGQGNERMDWWVDRKAEDIAYNLATMRWAALKVPGVLETPEQLDTAVREAHETACPYASTRELAESAYDDAVRQLGGVSRETVRDLLTRLTTGDVDLDRAITELTT